MSFYIVRIYRHSFLSKKVHDPSVDVDKGFHLGLWKKMRMYYIIFYMYVCYFIHVRVCMRVCVCVLGLNNLEIYLIIFTDIALAIWFAILEGMITFTSLFSSWLIEKHSNDNGVIIAEICTKQRCFLKPVEYIWYIYIYIWCVGQDISAAPQYLI